MKKIFSLIACYLLLLGSTAFAQNYIAYSLETAKSRISSGSRENNVINMGGITHPIAAVYDKEANDIIIVGKVEDNHTPVSLDDWTVAVNAILKVKRDPAVSIDRTNETEQTNKQNVRFEGGLENTQFGNDLLAADVILKRLGLNTLSAEIFNVSSYLNLSIQDFARTGKQNPVVSRFWFLPDTKHAKVTVQDGLIIAEEYRILIKNEIMATENEEARDLPAEIFASNLYANFQDVKLYYPELSRLEQLYYVAALAQGLESSGMASSQAISYWLNDFSVKKVVTPKKYSVEKNSAKATFEDKELTIMVSGGIDLGALVYRLQSGGIDDIKNYIIQSRPDNKSLSWEVPLLTSVWDANYDPTKIEEIIKSESKKPNLGTSLDRRYGPLGSTSTTLPYSPPPPPPSVMRIQDRSLSNRAQSIAFNSQLTGAHNNYTPHVGGVMLQGAATLYGGDDGALFSASGNFSLVVDGKDSRIDPQIFRKFVTALWSVYYCDEPPGISIDPIAPDVDEHLVRYIGNVINNDLGRVMREADYTMKQLAVGTEKSQLPGFKSPAQFAAKRGVYHVGAYSRFWFVPENMRFKQSNNILMFESGTMKLKTEYMFSGGQGQSSPENEDFARYFTENYEKISEEYPIYKELFEYAKLVSLAQYLKENKIPLHWFLMANKDLIITENSKGTVKELVKGLSDFPGIKVMGGVELGTKKGQYVYDTKAVTAINNAISKLPSSSYAKTSLIGDGKNIESVSESISFELENKNYTVLPQHSPTSGKDRRGIRYQTDIALKNGEKPGLEMVRYFDPNKVCSGEFGEDWHLLVPYRIKADGDEKIQFQNVLLPKKMIVTNLISSEEEVLEFNKDRYSIVGYLPDSLNTSQTLGLMLMQDLTYRLADKLGNEFHFDQSGYMTEMVLAGYQQINYEYDDGLIDNFEGLPYEMQKVGDEQTDFLNVTLPKRMEVKNLINETSEIFVFKSKWGIGAYVPEKGRKSNFKKMLLMTDASFRLYDNNENTIDFNQRGSFAGITPNPESNKIIKSISQQNQTINFKYALGGNNSIRISEANLQNNDDKTNLTYTIKYYYDQVGRLTRVGNRNSHFTSR